jgi:putative hydrolase of the HAD superfamily
VNGEYDKVGKERLEWYDLNYWIRKFDLNIDGKELLGNFEHKIKTYPEVPNVLEQLKQKGFRLIILTNAHREFVELELNKAKIGNYFDHVFSSTSDFRMVKKTENLYKKVCNALRISTGNDPYR